MCFREGREYLRKIIEVSRREIIHYQTEKNYARGESNSNSNGWYLWEEIKRKILLLNKISAKVKRKSIFSKHGRHILI